MMSEKKNKYPPPDSVAMGESNRASKENMNLVRYSSLYFFFVCVHLWNRRKLTRRHLFYCVSLGLSAFFLALFIYADCLLSVGFRWFSQQTHFKFGEDIASYRQQWPVQWNSSAHTVLEGAVLTGRLHRVGNIWVRPAWHCISHGAIPPGMASSLSQQ